MGQQNQNSKLFGLSQMQNRGASNQRFPNVGMNFTNFNNNMPQFTQKMNTPYVQQPMQTGGITISLFNFSVFGVCLQVSWFESYCHYFVILRNIMVFFNSIFIIKITRILMLEKSYVMVLTVDFNILEIFCDRLPTNSCFNELALSIPTKRVGLVQSDNQLIKTVLILAMIKLKNCSLVVKQCSLTRYNQSWWP
jgi:hypothetical protein